MATYCVLRQLRSNVKPHYWTLRSFPSTGSVVLTQVTSCKEFHTSCLSNVDHRKERAVIKHLYYRDHEKTLKQTYSPVVELPDYTYLDGRPTEMTLSYKEKQEKNYNLAKQVVKLVDEVKFAQSQFTTIEKTKEKHEHNRKKQQLKEKGQKS